MAFCSNCGTSLPGGARFCSACGQSADAQSVQPAAPDNTVVQEASAPQQGYSAQPEASAPQQGYSAQPEASAPQQGYSAQPETSAPQQSYYAQPEASAPQQNDYAQQGAQNQQQSYYAPQGGAQNQQQNYYAPQQNNYGYQQNYQQQGPSYQTNAADIEENKGICVLCYLGLLLLIPLLTKPNSGYVKFHSNQGLVLMIMSIVIGILSLIPYLGWFIIAPIGYIFSLVCIIIGIINAVGGEMKPLPLIGGITLIK